jgi:hypothetical protein
MEVLEFWVVTNSCKSSISLFERWNIKHFDGPDEIHSEAGIQYNRNFYA